MEWKGFKIKGLRLANHVTPTDMAEVLDITPTYLSLIETGRKNPSKKVIRKAAAYFKLTEDEIIKKPEWVEQIEFEIQSLTTSANDSDKLALANYLITKFKN